MEASRVKLIGLDFGTTTSSAVIAAAQVRRNATGRMELDCQEEIFRSEMVFTPLDSDDRLDINQVERLLNFWLNAGQVRDGELFGGGALLTGLTAQKDNAAALVQLIRRRLGDTLVATADDPCLESWLAFMGSCAALSQQHPDQLILNLDIGGGTTNLALGQNRQVLRTGCWFLGARHVQVIPGTYRIVKLSTYARDLFTHFGIAKGPGAELTETEVDAFLGFYLTMLEVGCTGKPFEQPIAKCLEQVRFQLPGDVAALSEPDAQARDTEKSLACASGSDRCSVSGSDRCIVTFSGGVGELIYRHLQGEPWPATTHYGDLGIDLARRIVASPIWADSLRRYRPKSVGRATVYGLLRHTTEVSGNTLFLGAPGLLPLADLPILGSLHADSTESHVRDVLTLVRRSSRGGCVQVRLGSHETSKVRGLGQRIAQVLQQDAFPPTHPLVLLVEENLGKILGQFVTRWGALPLAVLVIDEVTFHGAQFVQIGLPRDQVVPVSFFGILPQGDRS